MRKSIVAAIGLVALLATVPLHAGESPLQNLAGADFKPGQLKLPLTVMERSGVDRKGVVVSSGVPFPPGFLQDVSKLAVVDRAGRPVVSQGNLMIAWHKPTYDDSVQWALVSFLADVPANKTATYYLVDSGQTGAASPLKVGKSGDGIAIETGPGRFTIPLAGQALLSSAKINGREILAAGGLRATITAGDWPDRAVRDGDRHVATHQAGGVTVEESGPARAVVAITGRYKPGDKDGKFYGFTTRLYFSAGSTVVRVIHTISNGQLDPKLEGGWRYIYTWPITDASLVADLALGGKATVSSPAEGRLVTSDKDLLACQSALGRYTLTEGGKELAAGDAHAGVMSVAADKVGLSAALRYFRLEYPHAIAGNARTLRIGLLPGELGAGEPFPINGGQRKSWDVRLNFFDGGTPDPQKESAATETLLLFRPEPAWMVRAGAAGCWPYGIGLLPDKSPGRHPLRRDTSRIGGQSGWDRHGMVGDWNSGGHHWNEESMYIPWVLWGDGANFDSIEASSIWSSDLIAFNYDHPDVSVFYLMLMQWNDHENRVKRVFYPGYRNHDRWGVPDSGHMGMVIVPEYYYLTGDARAREAVVHLGNSSRAVLWKFNHDDKKDGTGPLPGPVGWCRKQDADADPDFKLDTRYIGWPLFNLANAYRITGDPQVLAECRNVAHAFRNTARYSPIGFMTLQINAKGSKEVYGGQGPFEKYRDLSASQCYAHFQQALMCHGLFEYYQMSRDGEALDPMIGFADLLCRRVMLRDPQGRMAGWTYAFGDYWGPYTWEDSGRGERPQAAWSSWHYNSVEALGWIAQFTGRADIVEVLEAAIGQYGPGFDIAAGVMAANHPHAGQPPAAIADLKAQPLAGGKVRLSWTAPAGKLGRYQVKDSTAKIVENVVGWPDRSEPLPADRKEWEARAAAFNARQRAFWAANTAANPPTPRAAGAAETMTIDGLAPGTYNFAVKSWSDGNSISRISNVVEVTVK